MSHYRINPDITDTHREFSGSAYCPLQKLYVYTVYDKALLAAPPFFHWDITLPADAYLQLCAQGESQEAAHCCEKSELQALAVKCVGAWEVQRILRCGAELQPPARHSFILRVRCPPGPQSSCTRAGVISCR